MSKPTPINGRRAAFAAAGLAFVLIVAVAAIAGAANREKATFTESVIAASITPDGRQGVFKVHDSVDGAGAGTSTTAYSSSNYPITGTDANISYFADGVQRSTDRFTIAKPDAHGISRYTATGKCTGGTRAHRATKCSFTATGTVDTSAGGIARIKVVGTYS